MLAENSGVNIGIDGLDLGGVTFLFQNVLFDRFDDLCVGFSVLKGIVNFKHILKVFEYPVFSIEIFVHFSCLFLVAI